MAVGNVVIQVSLQCLVKLKLKYRIECSKMPVRNVVIQVSLKCLVKLKVKVWNLIYGDVIRECGGLGKSEVSGETESESKVLNVQRCQ